ncbi:tetratricopeptide repeat (TPR)-like superfamily protein [Carex rostrata]
MHFLEALLQRHFTEPSKIFEIHALLITSGFFLLPKPSNTFSFNCLIQSYLRQGKPSDAPLRLFVQLLSSGAQPNHHTFPSILKSSSPISGVVIHGQSVRRGLVFDNFVGCSLMKFYAKLGRFVDAKKVFDEMPHPDLASSNAMLDVACASDDMGSANEFFEGMTIRNIISWTTLINGFSKNGSHYNAIWIFRRLIHESENVCGNVSPNEATFVCVLSSCANLDGREGLAIGKEVHAYIVRHRIHLTAFLGTALIDLYGKHGHLHSCENTFKSIVRSEVCTWNAMIFALACNGEEEKALHMFDKMPSEGVVPNHITLVAVLTACSRAGLVDLGLRHFESMVAKHGLTPLMEHYGCVVDLLGRAGWLHKAVYFIERMPFKADVSVWGALLGACKLHGNAKLGEYVMQKLISLEPWHGGQYMTLRNMYAQKGRWRDVVEMTETMVFVGIKKAVGTSYVNSTYATFDNPASVDL